MFLQVENRSGSLIFNIIIANNQFSEAVNVANELYLRSINGIFKTNFISLAVIIAKISALKQTYKLPRRGTVNRIKNIYLPYTL